MLLFSGNANRTIAQELANTLGIPLGKATVAKFADGEIKIILNENVRHQEVYIIQPTCPPVNDHVMELCLLANALQRAGASRIVAVVPYFGYARQDFAAAKPGMPLGAQVVANFLNSSDIDQLMCIDLHAAKISDFFNFPVHNLSSLNIFRADIQSKQLHNPVIVAPDIGGEIRARKFTESLKVDLAVIAKQRCQNNDTAVINILGMVKDRDCIIIDDIVDTGNTLLTAVNALKAHGARKVFAYCTHAVLSGNALQRLLNAGFTEIVVTDTIELRNIYLTDDKFRKLSIVNLLAQNILEFTANATHSH